MAFAREGTVLASGSADGTILVRDILSIQPDQRTLETAWAELAEADAKKVDQALAAFVNLPKPAVHFLKKHCCRCPAPSPGRWKNG